MPDEARYKYTCCAPDCPATIYVPASTHSDIDFYKFIASEGWLSAYATAHTWDGFILCAADDPGHDVAWEDHGHDQGWWGY